MAHAAHGVFLMLPILLACPRKTTQQHQLVFGCSDPGPPIPPAGSITFREATSPDSALEAEGRGGIVMFIRWANETVAATSAPNGAIAYLDDTAIIGTFGSAPTTGVLGPVLLSAAPRVYMLRARFIGAFPVGAAVTLRRGYLDTAEIRIQPRPTLVCS